MCAQTNLTLCKLHCARDIFPRTRVHYAINIVWSSLIMWTADGTVFASHSLVRCPLHESVFQCEQLYYATNASRDNAKPTISAIAYTPFSAGCRTNNECTARHIRHNKYVQHAYSIQCRCRGRCRREWRTTVVRMNNHVYDVALSKFAHAMHTYPWCTIL